MQMLARLMLGSHAESLYSLGSLDHFSGYEILSVSRLFWSNDFLVFSPLFFLFYLTSLFFFFFIRYGLSTVGYSFVSYTHLRLCLVCRFLAIFAILEASCAHHRSLSTLFDHTASFSPQISPSDQHAFIL